MNEHTKQDLPWFKLWPTTIIAETSHLSAEELGAYFALLCRYWMNGNTLPNDMKLLKRWTRADETVCTSILEEFFTVAGDSQFAHAGMDSLRSEADGVQEVNRERGKKGAAARWSKVKLEDTENASTISEHALINSEHAKVMPKQNQAMLKMANKEVEEEVDTEGEVEAEGEAEADEEGEADAEARLRRFALLKAEPIGRILHQKTNLHEGLSFTSFKEN